MIALIRQIILCVTAASLFGAVALSLVSDGALKEVIRMGVGLVLILSLALPLRRIISLPSLNVGSKRDAVREDTTDVYQEAIKQQVETETAQYVVQQAAAAGVSCRAHVSAKISEEGTVSIVAVSIAPDGDISDHKLKTFKQQISTQLGVSDDAIVMDKEGLS